MSARYRPAVALALVVYGIVFGSTLALAANWSRIDRAPSIRLLGSGGGLSVLITAPHARLLIATGTDASAFGNAVGNALHPTNRRIDVLILAGGSDDLPVAVRAHRDVRATSIWTIAGPLAAKRAEFGIPGDRVIAAPTSFRLDRDFTVTITPDPSTSGDWLAEIRFGHTIVYAGSETMIATIGSKADAIVSAGGKLPDIHAATAPPVIGLSVNAGSYAKLSEFAGKLGAGFYALRVAQGDAITIRLTTTALVLPNGTRRIEPNARD